MKALKNPKRYVEILKRQRDRARERADLYQENLERASEERDKAGGAYWFTYADGVEQNVALSPLKARKCRIESKVAIHGKVIKIEPSKEAWKYVITFALGEVRILEE